MHVLVMLMMAISPAFNVAKIVSVSRATCTHCLTMMMTTRLFSALIMPPLVAEAVMMVLIVALPMLVCTMTHRVMMMTTAQWTPSKNSLAL